MVKVRDKQEGEGNHSLIPAQVGRSEASFSSSRCLFTYICHSIEWLNKRGDWGRNGTTTTKANK